MRYNYPNKNNGLLKALIVVSSLSLVISLVNLSSDNREIRIYTSPHFVPNGGSAGFRTAG